MVVNSLLTRGLRPPAPPTVVDWRELVTTVLREEWPAPAASKQTSEAERGLGILGQPYYFYVLRAESSFGFVVFVLREAEDPDWPEDAKGAAPFDTGGWWKEKISTRPQLSRAARIETFRTLNVPLQDWQRAFDQHVRAQYAAVGDYVNGHPPANDRLLGARFAIPRGENTARAWTWEVRIPHGLIAGRLVLRAVSMNEDVRGRYIQWLWKESLLEDRECAEIHEWMDHKDHIILPRKHGDAVAQAVNEWLVQEVTSGPE